MGQPLLLNCALLFVLLALSGCDPGQSLDPEPLLNSSSDGKTVKYRENQSFSLELDVSADAGYTWDCRISKETVVCLDSTSYRSKSGNRALDGGMTVETFHFRTLKVGECSVALDELRSWLPEVAPINSVRINIVVFP